STRRDLLPADIADELAKLQDRVPPFPGAIARESLERAYGRALSQVFGAFDETPLAAASIAQVHAARLPGGAEVVVKVLRPGMRAVIERDLEVLHALADLAHRYWAEGRPQRPRYAAVDFGIVGTLDPADQHYLAENFLAVFDRDYRRVAQLHLQSGWVPPDTRVDEMESAVRTVCEPIFDRPLKDISFGRILLRLFEISRRF